MSGVSHDIFVRLHFQTTEVLNCLVSLVPVDLRDAAMLLPIVRQHIAPGSTTISVRPLGGIQQARNTTIPASYR